MKQLKDLISFWRGRIGKECLTNLAFILQEEIIQIEQQQYEQNTQQCKQIVNIICNQIYICLTNFAKAEQLSNVHIQLFEYLVQQCEYDNNRFEYANQLEYSG
ncbi:Hypothetical_protein [Hexamita inflata]|uniref:Hypothetical_protein n=1 Tax=Hexamita inflata TaxID=28002 RepID=A0AA86UL56_9EUKA|nr:Hypothetical protein HINF_LOCUS50115 [Hexamita inflata]CAI9962472.1 Hypothetical protein HINF_LOCUS50117 [Hexamita inflata]